MFKYYKRVLVRTQKFSKNQEGATAIEFALVAIPFFAIVFAIIELAIIFFISSTLNHAVSETGRLIRTGNFQNCGQDLFKELVCDNMAGLAGCSNNLTLDVLSQPEFQQIQVPDQRPLEDDGVNEPTAPDGAFDSAPASTPVVVQATFYYKLALPPQLTRLESIPGSGLRVIRATTAFRTEPFPPSTECPPSPTTPTAPPVATGT